MDSKEIDIILGNLIQVMKKDAAFKPKVGSEGAPGPEGKAGRDGQKGDPGPVGPKGPVGPPGDRGKEGPEGPRGPQGEQGAEGKVGPKGETGPRGAAGAEGTPGARGPKGDLGASGPRGRDGEPGAPGVAGANYSCRATTREPFTVNPGEWTTVHFNSDSWDSGSFHSTTANTEFLSVSMAGIYYVEACVDGVDKIRIVYINSTDNKETVVAQMGGSSCDTLWKAKQYDKFRVDVFCNNTWGVNPTVASPVFIIQKNDKVG